MGRFATNLAAYAANVDHLPSKDELPQVSFWEAVLPGRLSDLVGRAGKKEEKPVDPNIGMRTRREFYNVGKDGKGKKALVAHKSPSGSQGGNGEKRGNDKGKENGKTGEEKKVEGAATGEKKGADDPWAAEDDKQLIDLKGEGKTWAQIAEITGRPKHALQSHWRDINPDKQNNQDNKPEEKKDNNGGEKKEAKNNEAKPTKAEKKAVKNAAKAEVAAAPTKPASVKAPSAAKSDGQARFTLGEWRTLQEDDVFSFGELQCLSELMLRDERQRWLRLASAFYDKTGRRVHSEDIREKFESMGA